MVILLILGWCMKDGPVPNLMLHGTAMRRTLCCIVVAVCGGEHTSAWSADVSHVHDMLPQWRNAMRTHRQQDGTQRMNTEHITRHGLGTEHHWFRLASLRRPHALSRDESTFPTDQQGFEQASNEDAGRRLLHRRKGRQVGHSRHTKFSPPSTRARIAHVPHLLRSALRQPLTPAQRASRPERRPASQPAA